MTKNIRTLTASLAFALATLVGTTALAAPVDGSADAVELDSAQFDAGVTLEGVINLNTASADQLQLLPGIGPSMAKKIINYRKDHEFKARNNIMRIKGIGKKTFNKIKDHLVVEGDTTLEIAG